MKSFTQFAEEEKEEEQESAQGLHLTSSIVHKISDKRARTRQE